MTRFLGLLLAIVAVSTAVEAQQSQPATAEPAKPVLTFNSDSVLVTLLIKPDKTADFEFVLGRLKEALANSPKSRAKGAGGRAGGSSRARSWLRAMPYTSCKSNQSSRVRSTDITRLIAEVFPVEVQELFSRYRDAFGGRMITDLTAVIVDESVMTMDPVRIWVAIAFGTALAMVARREGHRLIARADAQWLAPYRRLYTPPRRLFPVRYSGGQPFSCPYERGAVVPLRCVGGLASWLRRLFSCKRQHRDEHPLRLAPFR